MLIFLRWERIAQMSKNLECKMAKNTFFHSSPKKLVVEIYPECVVIWAQVAVTNVPSLPAQYSQTMQHAAQCVTAAFISQYTDSV